jgi:hypothetical protein
VNRGALVGGWRRRPPRARIQDLFVNFQVPFCHSRDAKALFKTAPARCAVQARHLADCYGSRKIIDNKSSNRLLDELWH